MLLILSWSMWSSFTAYPIPCYLIVCSCTNGACAACCGGKWDSLQVVSKNTFTYPLVDCPITCGPPQTYISHFQPVRGKKRGKKIFKGRDKIQCVCSCNWIHPLHHLTCLPVPLLEQQTSSSDPLQAFIANLLLPPELPKAISACSALFSLYKCVTQHISLVQLSLCHK